MMNSILKNKFKLGRKEERGEEKGGHRPKEEKGRKRVAPVVADSETSVSLESLPGPSSSSKSEVSKYLKAPGKDPDGFERAKSKGSRRKKRVIEREEEERCEGAGIEEAVVGGGRVHEGLGDREGDVVSKGKLEVPPTRFIVDGLDRTKMGVKDVYVVCEDLTQGVRRIKKEVRDEDILEGVRQEGNGGAGGGAGEGSGDALLEEMAAISKGIRAFLFSDANKTTRWVANRVMDDMAKYELVLHKALLENAHLRGRLEVAERTSKGLDRVEATVERLEEAHQRVQVQGAGAIGVPSGG